MFSWNTADLQNVKCDAGLLLLVEQKSTAGVLMSCLGVLGIHIFLRYSSLRMIPLPIIELFMS